ncbi:ISL3 family transposase [Nocardia sp. NPDC051929]|uniref:ISL3 family transposase n=1 Tax=unclassified Nocardia TaxID=2637762 RepID=UPI00343B0259
MFPDRPGVRVVGVSRVGPIIRFDAVTREVPQPCPVCGVVSSRVHSRYSREIADVAVASREVVLRLAVRRLFCGNGGCGRRIFAEQVSGLTVRYGRRSLALRDVLRRFALALGGRPAARLCAGVASAVSRMTLLRLIRALPQPTVGGLTAVGVDEFAFRKGRNYGTILVDMATRRPVDLLPEASSDALAAWLREHPGIEVICRDRAGYFADGARRGAPDAVQVADRWHLLANLTSAVERVLARKRSCLNERDPDQIPAPPIPQPAPPDGPLAQRITRQHPQIQQMLGQGWTISAIARELHLDRKTVRRYARSEVEGLLSSGVRRASLIDPFVPYLQRRWREGCVNAAVLHSEIAAQGFGGSVKTVRRHLQHWRVAGAPVLAPPTITPRKAAGWIMRRCDDLTDDERERLRTIIDRCDEIATTAGLATEFAMLLQQLRGAELAAWTHRAQASGIREISSFATTLHRDWDAVVAGLTLPYSNGPTEGNVNRLKLIKRAMYGRARFDLLRLRVLATS